MDRKLDAARTGGLNQRLGLYSRSRAWIDQRCHMAKPGHGFNQNVLPLAIKLAGKNADASRVAAWLGQRAHEARANRIIDQNDERNCLRRRLRSARRRFSAAQNDIDLSLDVVLCNFSKSFDGQSVTPPIHSKILAVEESERVKFGNECQMLWRIGRRLMQTADPINAARFLSVAGQRPCHCRTTKKTDERPPSHLRPYVEAKIIAARSSSVEGVGVTGRSMSALGQKRTCAVQLGDVRFVPIADIHELRGARQKDRLAAVSLRNHKRR